MHLQIVQQIRLPQRDVPIGLLETVLIRVERDEDVIDRPALDGIVEDDVVAEEDELERRGGFDRAFLSMAHTPRRMMAPLPVA